VQHRRIGEAGEEVPRGQQRRLVGRLARAHHFGHFRFAKTGILDAFFERYLTEGEPKGLSFLDWGRTADDAGVASLPPQQTVHQQVRPHPGAEVALEPPGWSRSPARVP
jgi:hypothetical protein